MPAVRTLDDSASTHAFHYLQPHFAAMMPRNTRFLICAVFLVTALVAQGDAPDQFNFAEALYIQLDHESAAEEFQRYLDEHPDGERAPKARYRIAECHFRIEDFNAAVKAYRNALEQHPDAEQAPLAHYNCARALERLDQTEAAAASFAAAAESGTGSIRREALLGAAEAQVELEAYQPAARRYRQLLDEFPDSSHAPDARFSLGWIQARLDQHQQAVKTFRQLIDKHPDHDDLPRVRLALSDSLTAMENYAESANVLASIEDKDLAGEVILRRAWNQFKAGDKLTAATTFQSYADRFPDSERASSALFNAGVARLEGGQYDEAAETFETVLAGNPGDQRATDARYWLAVCRFNAAKYSQAVETLTLLADNDKLPAERRHTLDSMLVQSLQHGGNHSEAIKHAERFLQTYPESEQRPVILYSLAAAREGAGERQKAVDALVRLLENHPESDLVGDARFAAAEYLYRLDQPAEALPHLRALADADALAKPARYRLAWCLYELERFDQARDHFAALAETDSEFQTEALYMAGRTEEQLENPSAAADWYRKTIAQDTESEHVEKAYLRLLPLTDAPKAATNFQAYLKRFPQGQHAAEMRLRLAESAFRAKNLSAAEKHYGHLYEQDAENAAAAYGLAWCKLENNQQNAADTLFAQALEHAETDAPFRDDAILQRAEIAYEKEDFESARKGFSQLSNSEAVGERALYMLGWCARQQERPEKAATWFRKQIERHPEGEFRIDAAIRLAETARAKNNFENARDVLDNTRKLISEERITEEFLHLQSDILIDLHDWKRALEVCDKLATDYPESEQRYRVDFRRGLAYQALGLHDKAEQAFRDTIDATDTIEAARAQFNIGSVRFSRGEFADAAKGFLRVEMLYDYPELAPKALYHAVLSFRNADANRRADLYAKKLQQSHPDSKWAEKLHETEKE